MTEILEQLKTALADRYTIEHQLGEGGMATVYLAHDIRHDRKVAVKVLRPELAAVIGAERFLNEIRVTANLQHPHILPLHDSGEASGFLFYVMPYVEGESLREKLDREKELGIDEALEIARSVSGALDYAHRHEVIHRDIKPANILMHDGQALVADFGIALAVSAASGTRLTETGLSVGTPHYMSPEQAMGDRELDARSDIYSLGCVLYEMLTGEPPYTGPTAQAIIAKVVTGDPPLVTAARRTVPLHVEAAVHKAIAKLPADRFGTASDFADALSRPGAVEAPAATTRPGAAIAKPAAPSLFHDWRFMAVSSLAVAAIAALVWNWARPTTLPKVARFVVALPEGQDVSNRFGNTIVLAPDGERLVYIGPGEGGAPQLWSRPIDQLQATPIPGTDGAFSPFFSPDGQSVAFFTLPPSLKIVSLAGGPPLTLSDSSLLLGGSWGPDEALYYPRTGEAGISRTPASGGPAEVITTADSAQGERNHRWIDALPNGRGAIFTIYRGANEEADIAVVSLETKEVRILLRGVFARYAASGHIIYARADGALLAAPFDQGKLELTGGSTPLIEGVVVKQGAAAEFTLSDDGSLIYLSGERPTEHLVWVDRDGTEEIVDPNLQEDFEAVAVSPDGALLALSYETEDGEDIWIYDFGQGTLSRLTFEGSRNERPQWMPNGRRVTFVSNRDPPLTLYTKPADGSGPAEKLVQSDRRIQEGVWSSDGRWLIYRDGPSGITGRDIKYIEPGIDTIPQTFLATEFDEATPKLAPDGRWLAYASDESGRNEVYVRPFPGPGGRWQVSTDGGREPLWAHSGRELFYRSLAGNLVSAEVRTEPTFSVGTRQVLFPDDSYERNRSYTSYDIAPDDQRFLMIKNVGGSREVVVVLNWFEELRARLGN